MSGGWTPVALSEDVPAGVVIPARAEGQDLALWRSASGRIAAWADRCPHRGMRLSHGFVRGEALSCIYHGWSYNAEGRCVRIPAHPGLEPPEAVRVPGLTAAEAGGVIWVASAAEGSPPVFAGMVAFRSLVFAVPQVAGGAVLLAGVGAHLLVQPLSEAECQVHVLVAEGTDAAGLRAVSRAVEALRRTAEREAA